MSYLKFQRALFCGALVATTGAAILKRSGAKNSASVNQNTSQSTLKAVAPLQTPLQAPLMPIQTEFRGQTLVPNDADAPPAVAREFRAAWVATVANMDWPSKSGLTAKQQQAEAIVILNRAVALKLNALIWQVRPMCDAFYRSELEPWSHYLSGTVGGDPGYDPLQFIIEQGHARGLEIHAWFNPYRTGVAAKTDYPAGHISKTHPDWVLTYGKSLWLDPGTPEVVDYSLQVIRDVTRRYDIDGVHFDDYFYPYQEKDAAGQVLPFPDDSSYQKYFDDGGRLAREDWRRDNVNRFVERASKMVREEKPDVKFGISPFGIWRPGYPRGIQGMDAWADIYADSRLWLQNGWVDYFVPQLYWSIDNPPQSFPVLLDWWRQQNIKGRHLWPGHGAYRIATQPKVSTGTVQSGGFSPAEIVRQVEITRAQSDANSSSGAVFFNVSALMKRKSTLGDDLATKLYQQPALVPASPWMEDRAPQAPYLNARWNRDTKVLWVRWRPGDGERVARWTLQTRTDGQWQTQILAASQREIELPLVELVTLCAVDRVGNQSAANAIRVR